MNSAPTADAATEEGLPLINGQGTPEPTWQAWDGLACMRTSSAASLVPQGRRAVILSPHPDDEVLATGGLIAALAALDRQLLVVGVTDGSASHPGSACWTPAALAELRRAESKAGLKVLGLNAVTLRPGLPDGELMLHSEALINALDCCVQAGDIVFAPWRHDGHPDHEAVGHAAAVVCERKQITLIEVPIWMWHWATPSDSLVPWNKAVRIDLDDELLLHKRAAIACHGSQLVADDSTGAPPILSAASLARWMRPYEVFFIT